MADFSNIYNEIDANINANGQQRITGPILNETLKDMLEEVDSKKQDTLQAGSGISISGNVISATGGGGGGQEYHAGQGIIIDPSNIISTDFNEVQQKLISGQNLRTVNGEPLLGSGDIQVQGGIIYQAGDGIDISNDTISVDADDLAGTGLFSDAEGNLSVNPSDLAGWGLMDAGSGQLAVDPNILPAGGQEYYGGNAITIEAGNYISVDPSSLAGYGLEDDGSGHLAFDAGILSSYIIPPASGVATDVDPSTGEVDVNVGLGLQVDGNNNLQVDTSVVQEKLVAGANITISGNTISATGGGGGGTTYTAGSGIDISGTTISVDENYLDGQYLPLEGGALRNTTQTSTGFAVLSPDSNYHVETNVSNSGNLEVEIGMYTGQTVQNPSDGYVKNLKVGKERLDLYTYDSGTSSWRADSLYFPKKKTGTIALDSDLAGKQDTLVAGQNITISGNVISATGGGSGSSLWVNGSGVDSLMAPGTADDIEYIDPSDPSQGINNQSEATGHRAIATGYFTKAYGDYSAAFGANTLAGNNGSFVIGDYSAAEGAYSFAAGSGSHASGLYTFATGMSNSAFGTNSAVFGYNNNTYGPEDFIAGAHLQTSGLTGHEAAFGTYNDTNSQNGPYLFTIGNGELQEIYHEYGTSSWIPNPEYPESTDSWYEYVEIRKNAVDIKPSGDVYIEGVGGYDGTNSTSSDTLQDVLNAKQDQLVAGQNITISGNVISATGGGGSGTTYTAGNGIDIDANNVISVDASDLAGWGLTTSGNNLEVDGSFLTGSGLTWDPTNKVFNVSGGGGGTGLWVNGAGTNSLMTPDAVSSGGTASGTAAINAGHYDSAHPGNPSAASGDYSAVFGTGTRASGVDSFATGEYNHAQGRRSAAIGGSNAIVSGIGSVSIGGSNSIITSNGEDSVVVGGGYVNSGGSVAIAGRVESGQASIAIGGTTNANDSIALGGTTYGASSVAIGEDSETDGQYSVALGLGSRAKNSGEVGVGQFNKSYQSNTASVATSFSVGNGSTSGGVNTYSNVLEIKKNNDAYLVGVGGFDGTNSASSDTLQDVINAKQDTLVSGTSIKTINGNSILGSGDIQISGGSGNYLPLTGGTLQETSGVSTDLLVESPGQYATAAISTVDLGSGTPESKAELTLSDYDSSSNSRNLILDTTGVSNGTYKISFPSLSADDTFALLSDIQGGGGSSYSAGSGINITNGTISSTTFVEGTGTDSIKSKNATSATGPDSVAIGYRASASANNAIALGANSSALKDGAVSVGGYVNGKKGIAGPGAMIDDSTVLSEGHGVAFGYNATVYKEHGIALGQGSESRAENETTIGKYNKYYTASGSKVLFSVGNGSSAINRSNLLELKQNNDAYLVGIGGFDGTNASSGAQTIQTVINSKQNQLVSGVDVKTINGQSIVGGGNLVISGGGGGLWTSGTGTDSLVAPGTVSSSLSQDPASGEGAISCGYDTNASGDFSFAQGAQSLADGIYSFAANNASAFGDYSAAFGSSSASGENSFAAGSGSTADGEGSVALAGGQAAMWTEITGPDSAIEHYPVYSTAIGNNAQAKGDHAVAIGQDSIAAGESSVALGSGSQSEGLYSVALAGGHTTENANYGFAAATGIADAHYSTALGGATTYGEESLASGHGAVANAFGSIALGRGVITYDGGDPTWVDDANAGEAALGRYNYTDENFAFSVGCGYLIDHNPEDEDFYPNPEDPENPDSTWTETVRQNAITITSDGSIYIMGLGQYDGTQISGAASLQDLLSNL